MRTSRTSTAAPGAPCPPRPPVTNGAESMTWERVPMPRFADETGTKVSSLWVQDTGAVWVTVGTDDFSFLLRTKRGAAPLSAPSDAQVTELASELDPAAAYNCENPAATATR